MSEYQYYEFRSVDRPLTAQEKEAICKLSSRVQPTSHAATFVYHYGDFRGKILQVLADYFDIAYYIANWGTQQLAFRFPKSLISEAAIAPYCLDNCIELSFRGDWAILNWRFHQEDGFCGWIEGEGKLDDLVELRQEILDQDYRSLYLAWLKAVTGDGSQAEIDTTQMEPPIPAGLQTLSAAQEAFIKLFEIDPHLVTVSATLSPDFKVNPEESLETAIAQLSRADCDYFLLEILRGKHNLSNQLKRKLLEMIPTDSVVGEPQRTVEMLLKAAEKEAEEWKQREKERAYKQKIKELEAFAPKEAATWSEIERLLTVPQVKNYDQIVKLLLQLQDLANYQKRLLNFRGKVQTISQDYSNRSGLIRRLREAKLL